MMLLIVVILDCCDVYYRDELCSPAIFGISHLHIKNKGEKL